MLSHQGVELLDKIRRVGTCGLVEGRESLGVVLMLSKVHAQPRASILLEFFPSSWPVDKDVALSYYSSTTCGTMLSAMTIIDETSDTVSMSPFKCSLS